MKGKTEIEKKKGIIENRWTSKAKRVSNDEYKKITRIYGTPLGDVCSTMFDCEGFRY